LKFRSLAVKSARSGSLDRRLAEEFHLSVPIIPWGQGDQIEECDDFLEK